jgi:hypothetical protein
MSKLDDLCAQTVNAVDDGLGFAAVDLDSGLLLGSAHSVPYFTQSYLDTVAAAAVDMFRGRTITAVEDLLASQRGVPSTRMIKEVQMTTDKTYHFMLILPNKPNTLLVLITGRRANLGMGWAAVRNSIPAVEALVP